MIKTVLVDDEEVGMEVIRFLLADDPDVQICGAYTNPFAALDHLEQQEVDAFFLDIEMPGMSGIDLARHIKKHNPSIHIVFITAYRAFALEAFDLYSLDYMLKPITKQRLDKAVSRLKGVIGDCPAAKGVSIRTFGDFQVTDSSSNQPFVWKTNKVKELCAFFIHHEGSLLERDYIVEALWPDVNVDKAKISLYTGISYLRKVFKEHGMEEIILKNGSAYYIDIERLNCDCIEWNKMMSNGTHERTYMEKRLDLYTGDYMEMTGFHWAQEKREYIRRQMLELLQQLEADYELAGMEKAWIHSLEKQLELSPYSDDVCQRLMNAYAKTGNRTEAVIVYRRFAELLEEDIGIQPSTATCALLASIMGQ
ncbi:response regulator [Bacillus sp. 37MA]|uniref:response regulator n=1 Tax=Bacillus sp. 37MA TaxID=1132442 RepID=UPI000373B4C0|nr:response regulator [Bacillus sp. 37MA]